MESQDPLPKLGRTVPAWIREEFVRFPELTRRVELIFALNSGIQSKTWEEIAERERQRHAEKGMTVEEIQITSLLRPLAEFLNRGMSLFTSEARLTIKERRKIADKIKDLSKQLNEELRRFDDPLQSVDWMLYSSRLQPEVLREQLLLLSDVAERWKNPRMAIHRPSENSAHRTYFIRTLSRGFQTRYGQPLNAITAEFTTVFFPGTEFEPADISRRRRPKKRQDRSGAPD